MSPKMMHRKNGQRLINIVFVRFVISETMLIATWRPPILSAPHSQWATHISAATAPSLSSHFLLVPFELVSVELYTKWVNWWPCKLWDFSIFKQREKTQQELRKLSHRSYLVKFECLSWRSRLSRLSCLSRLSRLSRLFRLSRLSRLSRLLSDDVR